MVFFILIVVDFIDGVRQKTRKIHLTSQWLRLAAGVRNHLCFCCCFFFNYLIEKICVGFRLVPWTATELRRRVFLIIFQSQFTWRRLSERFYPNRKISFPFCADMRNHERFRVWGKNRFSWLLITTAALALPSWKFHLKLNCLLCQQIAQRPWSVMRKRKNF